MMTKSTVVAAIVFSLTIGAGAAFGAKSAACRRSGDAAAGQEGDLKACSDQANARICTARSARSSERSASAKAARCSSGSLGRELCEIEALDGVRDHRIRHALFADEGGQRPRVDAGKPDDAAGLQPLIEMARGAVV